MQLKLVLLNHDYVAVPCVSRSLTDCTQQAVCGATFVSEFACLRGGFACM